MKIFLVVGTLFHFDRLVKEMDQWAGKNKEHRIIAQIGDNRYKPENFEYHNMLDAHLFNKTFDEADLIIAHAGMGIVLKSLVANKPIIIMPRKLELKEHNTDHQMATARALNDMNLVHIAWDNEELLNMLSNLSAIKPKKEISEYASAPLIQAIDKFIADV